MQNFNILSSLSSSAVLVEPCWKPEDRFPHDKAHVYDGHNDSGLFKFLEMFQMISSIELKVDGIHCDNMEI